MESDSDPEPIRFTGRPRIPARNRRNPVISEPEAQSFEEDDMSLEEQIEMGRALNKSLMDGIIQRRDARRSFVSSQFGQRSPSTQGRPSTQGGAMEGVVRQSPGKELGEVFGKVELAESSQKNGVEPLSSMAAIEEAPDDVVMDESSEQVALEGLPENESLSESLQNNAVEVSSDSGNAILKSDSYEIPTHEDGTHHVSDILATCLLQRQLREAKLTRWPRSGSVVAISAKLVHI